MARVTVEDCVVKVPNRFELIILSSKRARDLSAGATLTVSRDNDKNSVVALREIAEDTLNLEEIRAQIIRNLQKSTFLEELSEVDQEPMHYDFQAVGEENIAPGDDEKIQESDEEAEEEPAESEEEEAGEE